MMLMTLKIKELANILSAKEGEKLLGAHMHAAGGDGFKDQDKHPSRKG